jgi:peptidoglycan/xylan/chitin deacetylase (PgdA/CDA1 family)
VTKVRERLLNRMRANFQAASASCVAGDMLCAPLPTVPAMLEAGRTLSEHLPAQYQAWYGNAATFHRLYAGELVRLAALFPKVSSEIDTFIATERMGTELPDGHFLWTFDDGPSKPAGTTDALLPVLEQNRIHAMFYVLGERLSARLKSDTPAALQKSYDGQCVGMHGWTHDSHQRMPQWQASVLDTQHLVQQTWPAAYRPYFRPPYGQRLPDSGAFFSEKGLTVALWNIDSQDWNAHVSERDAAQRVLTLMLTWRSGVILFHDIHTKAVGALPWIVAQTRQSGVSWDDCRRY